MQRNHFAIQVNCLLVQPYQARAVRELSDVMFHPATALTEVLIRRHQQIVTLLEPLRVVIGSNQSATIVHCVGSPFDHRFQNRDRFGITVVPVQPLAESCLPAFFQKMLPMRNQHHFNRAVGVDFVCSGITGQTVINVLRDVLHIPA